MAAKLLKQLKQLARQGRTIICTVHQPDPRIFTLPTAPFRRHLFICCCCTGEEMYAYLIVQHAHCGAGCGDRCVQAL